MQKRRREQGVGISLKYSKAAKREAGANEGAVLSLLFELGSPSHLYRALHHRSRNCLLCLEKELQEEISCRFVRADHQRFKIWPVAEPIVYATA